MSSTNNTLRRITIQRLYIRLQVCICKTVEPLLYDHPHNHIGVVV